MARSHHHQEPLQDRRVYFLICWNEQDQAEKTETWYFKLEIPGSTTPRLFKTLEEVMATIENELDQEQTAA